MKKDNINEEIAKRFFNKYFKHDYIDKDSPIFISFVKILNKKDKKIKELKYIIRNL